MRAQISRAILAVAVLIVIGLGLPLAVVVQRFYEDRAAADLQRRAAETIVEISLPLDADELAQVASEPDTPGEFTVYDHQGRRLYGDGPPQGDAAVTTALAGQSSTTSNDHQRTLAAPITDRSSETVVGAVLVTQPSSLVDSEVHQAWVVMAIAVTVALAGATALARAQSRHLAAPVARLADQAVDLGRGDFTSRVEPSGITEVDTVARALNDSAARLADLLARERAFSSDVSHQLRTPLTGLRLRLERASATDPQHRELTGALAEVARLEATVEHLLALSRDRHPVGAPLAVTDLLDATSRRWQERFAIAGRDLHIDPTERTVAVRGSDVALGQVLDVLIDNTLEHGRGAVTISSRVTPGGLVLEVTDQGPGIEDNRRDAIFERHEGTGNGIGLALARSITEAEGGRLLLGTGKPPCFQVVLPEVEEFVS
jgi:signal transduction histidine kinase